MNGFIDGWLEGRRDARLEPERTSKEPKQENEDMTKTSGILRKKNYLTVGSLRQRLRRTASTGHGVSTRDLSWL